MKKIISLFLVFMVIFSSAYAEVKDTTFYKLVNMDDGFINKLYLGGATMDEIEAFVDDMDLFVEGFQESIYMQDIDAYFITILLQTLLKEEHINVLVAFNEMFEEEMIYMSEYKKVPSSMTYFKIVLFGNKVVVQPSEPEELPIDPEELPIEPEELPIEPEEPPAIIEPEIKSPFEDVKNGEWYTESITELFERGIISGRPDGLFYPEDYITREEALKIVVESFLNYNIDYEDYGKSAEGTWYYKYLAIAEYFSIISGMYNEESFSSNVYMTRQEFITLVYRAAIRADVQFPNIYPATDFLDMNEFSFFAVEPVRELLQAGLINGVGDNKFAPANLITRAEVSKVVYKTLSL